jgi:Rod binding domain-containing protein
MSDTLSATTRTFLDFQGLGSLRGQARSGQDPQALSEAARQFEAQLLHMMLESMRKSVERDEENASGAQDLYQEMMDREVALLVARRGGIGLATILERQLGGEGGGVTLAPAAPQPGGIPLDAGPPAAQVMPIGSSAASTVTDTWRVLQSRGNATGLPITQPAKVSDDE